MMIQRLEDWRPRLSAYVHSIAGKPFQWGVHDCALFTAGAVEAMTGHDYAADYRGTYTTLIGGLRKLKKSGFDSHADMAASLFDPIASAFAQVGDLAAIETEIGIALGVVQGTRIYVLRPGEAGIGTVDLLSAHRAFRVPS